MRENWMDRSERAYGAGLSYQEIMARRKRAQLEWVQRMNTGSWWKKRR